MYAQRSENTRSYSYHTNLSVRGNVAATLLEKKCSGETEIIHELVQILTN